MPCFAISTNLPRSSIPANFLADVTALVAKICGKPESYVMVQVNPDQLMSFAGTSEPCAHCTLSVLGKAKNAEFSKQLMAKIQQDLKIQPNRIFIFFNNYDGGDIGFNGATF